MKYNKIPTPQRPRAASCGRVPPHLLALSMRRATQSTANSPCKHANTPLQGSEKVRCRFDEGSIKWSEVFAVRHRSCTGGRAVECLQNCIFAALFSRFCVQMFAPFRLRLRKAVSVSGFARIAGGFLSVFSLHDG